MDNDRLETFPFVKVRLACRRCSRSGSYKLARLADKYGAQIKMADLLAYLAGDCKMWERRHPHLPRCGAFFVDLEWPPRPPDLPTEGERRLRIVSAAKKASG